MWLTISDVEKEYGINDFPLDENRQPDIERVNNAISDSEYFVNSYLRKASISLPINEHVFNQIKKCALVVTRYYYSFSASSMSNELIREYDSMRLYLLDIANGKILIDDGSGGTANKNGGIKNIDIFLC